MHKRLKLDGHNAHVLRDEAGQDTGYLYTVNPEKERATAWVQIHTLGHPETREYVKFVTLPICSRKLGQLGYLQSIIRTLREAVRYTNARTYLTGMSHMSPDERIDNAFRMISKINKEESNMNHYVLICKIKSDNDRVTIADEYIQVIQNDNGFTLLFDKADISEEEFKRFVNYLHSNTGGLLKNCYHSMSYEFGNYTVRVTVRDADVYSPDNVRARLLDIFTEGIKQHGVYPCTPTHRFFDDISSVEFYIQELGPDAKPIYKKEWPSLLTGTLRFWPFVLRDGVSRSYIHNLVACDPFQTLSVIDGRVKDLPFHEYPLLYGDIFHKEYSDKDELISDFRKLFDDRKIFANASNLNVVFEPDHI